MIERDSKTIEADLDDSVKVILRREFKTKTKLHFLGCYKQNYKQMSEENLLDKDEVERQLKEAKDSPLIKSNIDRKIERRPAVCETNEMEKNLLLITVLSWNYDSRLNECNL